MNPIDRENEIELRNVLRNVGMDDKESSVYLALLSGKTSSASELSKATNLNRATIYFIIDRLLEKGFVSQLDKGKIRHFAAQPVEKLIAHAQNVQRKYMSIEQQLKDAMPLFSSMISTAIDSPDVQLLHGLDGMKQTYKNILPHEFVGFWNPDVMYKHFGMTMVQMLFGKKLAMKGRDLVVQGEFLERAMKESPSTKSRPYRLLPTSAKFDCDMMIWEDKAAFFTYDKQYTVIQIQNKTMIDMLRSVFEILWNISTEVPTQ